MSPFHFVADLVGPRHSGAATSFGAIVAVRPSLRNRRCGRRVRLGDAARLELVFPPYVCVFYAGCIRRVLALRQGSQAS